MSSEEPQEVRVIHVPQWRLDVRRVIVGGISIILLIYAIHHGRIDPRNLRIVAAALLGAVLGVTIGYIRAPAPDYYLEIDVRKLWNRIDIRMVPKHLRPPREPSITTGTEGGSTAYIITNDELAELQLSELNVRRDQLRSLARRVVRLEKTVAERLADIEIEGLRYARQLFERYLRLRKKLAQEAVERPRREVGSDESRT